MIKNVTQNYEFLLSDVVFNSYKKQQFTLIYTR